MKFVELSEEARNVLAAYLKDDTLIEKPIPGRVTIALELTKLSGQVLPAQPPLKVPHA